MIKYVSHSLILLCLLGAYTQTSIAQDQKIGYVDTDHILSQMPDYEGIQQQLNSISSEWENELKEMEQEIEELKEEYQSKEILFTDEMKEKKKLEIQNLEDKHQQYLRQKFGDKGEYFQKQKELLEPIQRKVFEAINSVAEQQNFDFIFDRAKDSKMIFGAQEWNLNDEVLRELDITLNDTSN